MDTYFIVSVIIFFVIIVLILKLVKKTILAVILSILFVFLIILAVGTLIFLDIRTLNQTQGFTLQLVYGDSKEAEFAINAPFEDGFPSIDDINSVVHRPSRSEDDIYVVYFSEDILESLLRDSSNYTILGYDNLSVNDIELSKEEVFILLNSKNSDQEYLQLLLEKNQDAKRSALQEEINSYRLSAREVLFFSLFKTFAKDLTGQSQLAILSAYRKGEITLVPERLTFKLAKFLPSNFIYERVRTHIDEEEEGMEES